MSDDTNTVETPVAKEQTKTDVPPTDHLNLSDEQWKQVFQHDRFKELNTAKTAAEKKLAEYEANQKKAEEEAAKQKGEFEKLYNENLPKIQGYEELNATLEGMLQAQLERIPEEKRKLVPTDYPAHKQLAWITENSDVLGSTTTTKNAPVNPSSTTASTSGKVMHKAEDLKDPRYYEKHKADIKLAIVEGRIED